MIVCMRASVILPIAHAIGNLKANTELMIPNVVTNHRD